MNFIKGLLGFDTSGKDKKSETCEFTEFKGKCQLFYKVSGTVEKIMEEAVCSIVKDEGDFRYSIRCQGRDQKNLEKEYYFPILQQSGMQCYQRKKDNVVWQTFQMFMEDKNEVIVRFDITQDNDELKASIFKEFICKILFEVKYKQSYKTAKSPADYWTLINEELKTKNLKREVKLQQSQQKSEFSAISESQASQLSQASKQPVAEPEEEKAKPEEVRARPEEVRARPEEAKAKPEEVRAKPGEQASQPEVKVALYPQLDALANDMGRLDIDTMEEKQEKIRLAINVEKLRKETSNLWVNTGKFCVESLSSQIHVIDKNAIFQVQDAQNFRYQIFVSDLNNQKIYAKAINESLNFQIDFAANIIKWYDVQANQEGKVYVFFFDVKSAAMSLKFLVHQCLYQYSQKQTLQEAIQKQDDLNYARKVMEEEPEVDPELLSGYLQDQELGVDKVHVSNLSSIQTSSKNRCISQAKILSSLFVTKGPNIGVYRNNEDVSDQLDLICNLPVVKTFQDEEVTPSKIMITEEDNKILIMNENENKSVLQLDIGTGKVVRELEVDGVNTIRDMCSDKKFSDLTSNPVFNCINQRNIFKMDPRVNKAQVAKVNTDQKIYAQNNKFTCLTTDKDGHIAVGNEQGDIRLYTKVGQNAKNLYPGLGQPILSLDTSKDGQWILATCAKYLLLLPTFDGKQNSGFKKTISDRRLPYKLTITPSDQQRLNLRDFTFNPAKFDYQLNEKEKYIIASVGKFSLIWSLRNILQGKINNYSIKEMKDDVCNSQFKYDSYQNIFTVMPNEICIQKTNKQ